MPMPQPSRHSPDLLRNARLKLSLVVLPGILLAGVIGYRLIEGWPWIECLYMTLITVSTVGFQEVHPLSPAGRLFTLALIVFGVSVVAIGLSGLFEALFHRQLRLFMEKRSMQRQISAQRDHVIICGYGRMGRAIAADLHRSGLAIVIVDNNNALIEDVEREGLMGLTADANTEEALERAGIKRAKSLVATLNTDAANLFLTLTARDMNPGLNIIVRAEDEGNARKFTQAGASRVVSPYSTGASHIVRLLTRPEIVDFVELVAQDENIHFEVSQLEITAESPFAGKTLAEGHVRQATGGMVLAIKSRDGGAVFDPKPDTRINVGDVLFSVRGT